MITPNTFRPHHNAPLLRTLRRVLHDEQGGSLVETAISFLLLLSLMFGVIQGSWAVYSYHFLANAAHEGTRYAIVRGGGWSGTGGTCAGYTSSGCVASIANVQNYVANLNFPGLRITPGQVCVAYLTSTPASSTTTCTASTTNANNRPGDLVQVTINYPFTMSVPGLPGYTINLSSTSQMVIAQ